MIEQQKELYSVCKYTKYTHLEDPKKGSELGPGKPICNGNYWTSVPGDVRNSGPFLAFG